MRTSCRHRSRAAPAAVLALFSLVVFSPAAPSHAEDLVVYAGSERAGTIVVRTGERHLYFTLGKGKALRYTVGVGKPGKQWSGRSRIVKKMLKPAFAPPKEVKRDIPTLPDYIRGGSPRNPLGAAALILAGGEYAIHGTNRPGSVGGFVSYGCIRMYNADVKKLYARVAVGTPVIVTR
jgi:lipoprotein-anchoring transpeptidase ErfK/SrfK